MEQDSQYRTPLENVPVIDVDEPYDSRASQPEVDTVSGSTYGMLEMRRAGEASPRARSAARAAKPQSRTATYVVIGCVAALVLLTMLGGVLNVGDHLMSANVVVGWIFYVLIAALVVVGIVWPVVSVARRPVFSLYQLHDEQGHARRRHCRMLVDNLVANTDVTDDEVAELEGYLERGDEADDLLIAFFEKKCIPAIDAETKRAASTAFFASAISRSPLVSTVTMLSINLDLVRSIVEVCGFRPTNAGLARLYSRVMLSALVVGGIEDSDLQDMLATLMGGGAGARASGMLLGSATEGLVSAFLVFRVGVITKRFLCAQDGPARLKQVRRASYREALSQMKKSGFMSEVASMARKAGVGVATSVASSVKNAAEAAGGQVLSATQSAGEAVVRATSSAGEAVARATSSVTTPIVQAANGAMGVAGRAAARVRNAAADMRDAAVGMFDDVFGRHERLPEPEPDDDGLDCEDSENSR